MPSLPPVKVAILGGSGFMGYDLARTLHESSQYEPIVYSTSAKSLVNLSRHNIDVRLVRYAELNDTWLPDDVAFLVNYAHPFGNRDGLSIDRQLGLLSGFIVRNLQRSRELRAVHISSMSVYEPFEGGGEFFESRPLRAPRSDHYARSKCDFEAQLATHAALQSRLLTLRPSVVYGPFCRPWTDALLAGFESGDIEYRDLGGRIQPLLVSDVSRFLIERFVDFVPGTFNLAGPQILRWHEFLNFFGNIVAHGRLVERDQPEPESTGSTGSTLEIILRDVFELLRMNLRQPRVKAIVRPWLNRLPAAWIERLQWKFSENLGPLAHSVAGGAPAAGTYCGAFFAQDRLVSMRATQHRFPQLALTPLESAESLLSRYHRFRFRDQVLT